MPASRLLGPLLCVASALPAAGCALAADGEDGSFGKADQARCPASELFRAIADDTAPYLPKGTVAPELATSGFNTVDPHVLVDSPEIFPTIAGLIESAEQSVSIFIYQYEVGSHASADIANAIFALDRARRRAGATEAIPVRILVNLHRYGWIRESPGAFFPKLVAQLGGLDLELVDVSLAAHTHIALGAFHNKVVVVDAQTAVVTSANVTFENDYWYPTDTPRHEAGFLVSGVVALGLEHDFFGAWGESREWVCGRPGQPDPRDCLVAAGPLRPALELPDFEREHGCTPMMITTRRGDGSPFASSVDNPQDQAFLAAFRHAERCIRIETPNINARSAVSAIVDAAARGVTVEMVVPRRFNETIQSVPTEGGGNELNVDELYRRVAERRAGDPCETLRVRWFSLDGETEEVGNTPQTTHVKYASFDEEVVIAGTANLDTQSWHRSREVNLVIDSAEIAEAWDARLFVADFDRGVPVARCAADRAPARCD